MKIYVNKRKELILKFDFEKFGGISNETMQIKNGKFTKEIEKEVSEAMQEIIERWQSIFDNIPTEELFAEKQKQLRTFSDFDETLTSLVENNFNKMWTEINKMMKYTIHYREENNFMKYTIHYSIPCDFRRYQMDAKYGKQLVRFLKMLTDEKAYGFEVIAEYV